jgi:hypothetical protein
MATASAALAGSSLPSTVMVASSRLPPIVAAPMSAPDGERHVAAKSPAMLDL